MTLFVRRVPLFGRILNVATNCRIWKSLLNKELEVFCRLGMTWHDGCIIKSIKFERREREMKKGKEYTTKQFGWDIIIRKTPKGWIVDTQSCYGWERYFIADKDALDITEPPSDVEIRLLSSCAPTDGIRYKRPPDRGEEITIKDAFGNDCKIRR